MIRPKLGVLIPYVPFYEKIAPLREEKQAFARTAAAMLGAHFDIVGGLVETESAAAEMGATFLRAGVDGVVVVPTVAVFGALGWAALSDLQAPVCLWCSQPDERVPEDFNIRTLIRNSGGLAIQALGNTLARNGRSFKVIWTGGCESVPERLREWALGAALAERLKTARLGRIGSVFPQMTDVAFDAEAWHGVPLQQVSAEEFAGCHTAIEAAAVQARVDDMRATCRIDNLTNDALTRSARLSLTLDQVVETHRLDAGAFNCHGANCLQDDRMGVTACYAVSRQTSEGRPFSCTGDIPTAIAMWMLSQLADASIYAELDMVDPEKNYVLLANGGEGHFRAAQTGTVTLTGNENFAGLHGRGAALQFEPFEGAATIFSFTPLGSGSYRCIAADGELLRVRLPGLRVFHAGFRFQGLGASDAFEAWCEAGAVHHLALAPGHWSRVLREAAAIRGFEWQRIGGIG